MANKRVQLKDKNSNLLFPRGRIDNIVNTSGTSVTIPYLNGSGKIPSEYIPSAVDDVVELLTEGTANPATCVTGDHYFNTNSKKIFTATGTNTWGTSGVDPSTSVIYVNLSNNKIKRWSGTTMTEISPQITPVQSVGTPGSTTSVPSEAAVRSAISAAATPYTLPAASTASLGGIKVDGTVFSLNSDNQLIAVAMTTTSIDNIASGDANRLVTGEKLSSLVTSKLTSYQTTVTNGTGISISNNTVSLAANYDIQWTEL